MSEFIEVCGLWANKDKNGKTYYSGPGGKLRYWVFKNNSDNEKAPDLRLCVSENKPRDEDKTTGDSTYDDDIPF